MLTKFRIKNFKCFDDLEIPKLSRLTIIGGKNNIGKTAILEAIYIFLDRNNPNVLHDPLGRRGIDVLELTLKELQPYFSNFDMKKEIILEATIRDIISKVILKFDPNFIPPTLEKETPKVQKSPQQEQPHLQNQLGAINITYEENGKVIREAKLYSSLAKIILDQKSRDEKGKLKDLLGYYLSAGGRLSNQQHAEWLGKLDVDGRKDQVVEFLKILEPRIKDISIIPKAGQNVIHADIGLKKKIPISYIGNGLFRILSYFLGMGVCLNGIALIDEIENGIYYENLPNIWHGLKKASKDFNCQLIATTHSYEFIKAIIKETEDEQVAKLFQDEEDFSYIRIEKIKTGYTAKTYDFNTLKKSIEADLEIR